jgi:hypothetical protein
MAVNIFADEATEAKYARLHSTCLPRARAQPLAEPRMLVSVAT